MGANPKPATHDELRSILGDVDDATTLEILGLNPTVADLEEAVMWASGRGDILGKQGRPLTGIAAQIFDILARDEQEEAE
jgi:hypothetical protein